MYAMVGNLCLMMHLRVRERAFTSPRSTVNFPKGEVKQSLFFILVSFSLVTGQWLCCHSKQCHHCIQSAQNYSGRDFWQPHPPLFKKMFVGLVSFCVFFFSPLLSSVLKWSCNKSTSGEIRSLFLVFC